MADSGSGSGGAVASADRLATEIGLEILRAGGNAVDAAIATNAAMAVVGPHLCGIGGDLLALVHLDGETYALNASGRAGSGADADALRAEGNDSMPFRHDVRSVTVPGCVDGWLALHSRFGSLPLAALLAPATALAADGFRVSPGLAGAVNRLNPAGRAALWALLHASVPEAIVTLPGVARTLQGIVDSGRDGFYGGEFGAGLIDLGEGLFTVEDLEAVQADWVSPLSAAAFGVDLHTMPPNSQGYLTLGGALLADQVDLPSDPDDPQWAHLLIECATAAGFDRAEVLHEGADGLALLREISGRVDLISADHASRRTAPTNAGDTTYLCTVDRHGMGVSLIQSNAAGFGSLLAEPNTGINLHNRGLGFCLVEGHAAEYGPGRRPPHTLSPALATRNGELAAVFGTMGGDAQPQILLQLAARLFLHGESPTEAVNAGRWALAGPVTGFDTWTAAEGPIVQIEGQAPAGWADELVRRGHRVERTPPYDQDFGHAHAITVNADGAMAGCADPRTGVGSCEVLD